MSESKPVLIFDIRGDYAHFRRPHTTSSRLSFSVPPPTTVFGIIGGILGLPKDRYNGQLASLSIKVAVKIKKPIERFRLTVNIPNDRMIPKGIHLISERSQITNEILHQVAYRIYVAGPMRFLDEFKYHLENYWVYTPCLGPAWCLATPKFISIDRGREVKIGKDPVPIDSISPVGKLILRIEAGMPLGREMVPIVMTDKRDVLDYQDILFSRKGEPLIARGGNYISLDNGENIVFLN